MTSTDQVPAPDIASGRLEPEMYLKNFSDLHPRLTPHEAFVEADRCYFCYDAPCTIACPTSIDIPLFIRQIMTDNAKGAAKTILAENIFGGMCARVCPVETLCEQACVRNEAEDKPVRIGMLQRYATDELMAEGTHPFLRAGGTGKRIAVVGGGPAGIACAHRLATKGHDVTVFDSRDKAGGLNEYGIAAYKAVDRFAQRELDFILQIGSITVETGRKLGENLELSELRSSYDAVFIGMGLPAVNALGLEGEGLAGVEDAVEFIAELRQAEDLSTLKVGRRVVVIGGGMTAVDAAVQSKLLGADEVTMIYRRGKANMNASEYEQELAQTKGVVIRHWARPVRILGGNDGHVRAVLFERTADEGGRVIGTGETFEVAADLVSKAIGQAFEAGPLNGSAQSIELEKGRIRVDAERRTSVQGIWAGGDCVAGGEDLTVAAVEDGKQAAESIHRSLATGR